MDLQKKKPLKSNKLRNSAKGESCTMNSAYCNYDRSTVVLCHSNKLKHGKGMGLKADDREAFYGCSGCHDFFDKMPGYESTKKVLYEVAKKRTHVRMIDKGLGDILYG